MANLSKSNVVNGNVISASDISALYDALTGDVTYDNINIQGSSSYAESSSYALTATTATSATTAQTSSKSVIPTAVTTGTYYLTMVTGTGNNQLQIDNNLEFNASTNNLVVTASYALEAETAPAPTVVKVAAATGPDGPLGTNSYQMFTGVTDPFPASNPNQQFVSMSVAFPTLPSLTPLGTQVYVNATPIRSDVNPVLPIYVDVDLTPGSQMLIFWTDDDNFNGQVMYTGYIK